MVWKKWMLDMIMEELNVKAVILRFSDGRKIVYRG